MSIKHTHCSSAIATTAAMWFTQALYAVTGLAVGAVTGASFVGYCLYVKHDHYARRFVDYVKYDMPCEVQIGRDGDWTLVNGLSITWRAHYAYDPENRQETVNGVVYDNVDKPTPSRQRAPPYPRITLTPFYEHK